MHQDDTHYQGGTHERSSNLSDEHSVTAPGNSSSSSPAVEEYGEYSGRRVDNSSRSTLTVHVFMRNAANQPRRAAEVSCAGTAQSDCNHP